MSTPHNSSSRTLTARRTYVHDGAPRTHADGIVTTCAYDYIPARTTEKATHINDVSFPVPINSTVEETASTHHHYHYDSERISLWPNRDPIGEIGFGVRHWEALSNVDDIEANAEDNPYVFVYNCTEDLVDLLGLTSAESGCCGAADVTSLLGRTLRDIEVQFATWSRKEKRARCKALYAPETAGGAWDIRQLQSVGFQVWPWPDIRQGTEGGCEDTVTWLGKCYKGHAVNYAMWGKVNRLCSEEFRYDIRHFLLSANTLTFLWKGWRYTWRGAGPAMQFTKYGYRWTLPTCDLPKCKVVDPVLVTEEPNWNWMSLDDDIEWPRRGGIL